MQIIVYDTSEYLATVLRAQAELTDIGVSCEPSWEEIRTTLEETPALFIVFRLSEPVIQDVVQCLAEVTRTTERAAAIVVADRGLERWEYVMREAGAKYFQCGHRNLAKIIQIAANHAKNQPTPQITLRERIWSSLPWGTARDTGRGGFG